MDLSALEAGLLTETESALTLSSGQVYVSKQWEGGPDQSAVEVRWEHVDTVPVQSGLGGPRAQYVYRAWYKTESNFATVHRDDIATLRAHFDGNRLPAVTGLRRVLAGDSVVETRGRETGQQEAQALLHSWVEFAFEGEENL